MNRLPKQERIHGRSDIETLFAEARHFRINPFKVVWRLRNNSNPVVIRMGISVSKRISRKAVNRNRIKRLIREAYRTSKAPFIQKLEAGGKHIDFFLVYSGIINPELPELKEKINLILERLTKDHDQNPGSPHHSAD
jgi:ribonuclease P protein component